MTCCKQTNFSREEFRRLFTERLPRVNRNLPNMADVLEKWLDTNWPIFCEGNTVAFHAPVGNISYFNKERPAKLIISGFCVAGQAGLKYVRSSLQPKNNAQNLEAQHAFDTPTMIRGIVRIIDEFGIPAMFGLTDARDTFNKAREGEIPFMLTQALCPVVVDGSSKAADVWRAMNNSPNLRCFISQSLNKWWRTINNCSDMNTWIYLMGKRKRVRGELNKLLHYSRINGDTVEITGRDQGNQSVFSELQKRFDGRVEIIRHAAWYGRN